MSTRLLIAFALLTLPACSAIVQPDTRRLGDIDTGSAPFDAGPPIDTNRIDPDAFTPMGVDSGPLTCAGGCNDGLACTTDRCVAGVCESTQVDGDGDGQISTECAGTDCNDRNGAVFVGAPEVCDDRIDNNCNGATDEGCVAPDNCDTAERVDLSSGRARVTGDTTGLMANYRTPCAMGARPDAVYRIDIAPGTDVRIETSGSVDVVLAASTSCGSFESRQCNDDRTQRDTNARLWLHNAPGTWFILVTGFATGPYTVDFETTMAASDRCRAGLLDITTGGTVVGIPSEMREGGTCGGDRLRESMFLYNSNTFRTLTMTAPYRPYLSVRSPDCSVDSEQACETGATTVGGAFQASVAADRFEGPLYILTDGGGDAPYALNIQP
jgi:hypothetical protein